jgi:uncharacterized protein
VARKQRDALEILQSLEGAVVAFSGGVDSTLLLHLAHQALGDRCVALTAVSPSLPLRERREAENLARQIGVAHELVESRELDRTGFTANASNRCYFCKSELFDHCFEAASRHGFFTVLYGATRDDLGDHRPGMAAARERGARAPLLEADLGKEEIRDLSRELGLSTWDKPAMACLSSRFPYGTRISAERLGRVERAEEVLHREGLRRFRVRYHGEVARVEADPEAWTLLGDPERRARITAGILAAGFRFVTLDLEPFRSGRLNEGATEASSAPPADAS